MTKTSKTHEVWLTVNAAYNPGEWRVSQLVIGPRGGKNWKRLTHGIPATGGKQQMFLEAGTYKITYWSNNWPTKIDFEVTDDGEVIWL